MTPADSARAGAPVPVERCVHEVSASDGYLLRFRTWEIPDPSATLILLNGVMSHGGWFEPLAAALSARGFHVVGADRRGSGLNPTARGDAPSAEILIEDLGRIVAEAHRADVPLFLVGWCWGGVLGLAASATLPVRPAGLVLLAPGLFPSARVQAAWEREWNAGQGRPAELACLGNPIEEEMFTGGPWLDFIRNDELRVRALSPRFLTVMKKLGPRALLGLARLASPVLLLLAERDVAVDNERTGKAFEQLGVPVRTLRFDCEHGMQFEVADGLAEAVATWIPTVGAQPHE